MSIELSAQQQALLLSYLHQDEAAVRWDRINAGGSRVVIILRPDRIRGRERSR